MTQLKSAESCQSGEVILWKVYKNQSINKIVTSFLKNCKNIKHKNAIEIM